MRDGKGINKKQAKKKEKQEEDVDDKAFKAQQKAGEKAVQAARATAAKGGALNLTGQGIRKSGKK